jgi:glutamine cyclotransferase
MTHMMKGTPLVLSLLLLAGCGSPPEPDLPPLPPLITYTVERVYKHDTLSYTEGFLVHEHQLFESSGAAPDLPQTRSMIGIEDMKNGKIDKKAELDRNIYFGEGIAFFKDRLYQLTYKNRVGFIYDAKTYKLLDSFRYKNAEGWALTTDSASLIMSDGTSTLTWLDPVTQKPTRTLLVSQSGYLLDSLNELEYIKGYIYANRYLQNYIMKIDPATGKVVGRLDLTPLAQEEHAKNPNADVLNGIAYDADSDKIYVTGKLWSGIYQLKFNH